MPTLYERLGGEAVLARLLRHFYADVRQDPLIGPIFQARIQEWDAHLEIIAAFWAGVTGGPRIYGRPMPAKHLNLGLQPPHFERWLHLWGANCRAQLPREAAGELTALAHHIAGRLQAILGMVSAVPPSSQGETL